MCVCVCDEKPCAHRESERWGSQPLTVVLEEGTWSEDAALLSRIAENQAPQVVQWFRICLALQGRWVRSPSWEDPTHCGAPSPELLKPSGPELRLQENPHTAARGDPRSLLLEKAHV